MLKLDTDMVGLGIFCDFGENTYSRRKELEKRNTKRIRARIGNTANTATNDYKWIRGTGNSRH